MSDHLLVKIEILENENIVNKMKIAIEEDDVEVFQENFEKSQEMDPNSGPSSYQYLCRAAIWDSEEIFKYLLDKVDLKALKKGSETNPFFVAARHGYKNIVKLLLEVVEDNYPRDDKGQLI